MIVLGLDTCLNACSVAVLDGGRVLARGAEVMARGHQERLAPLAAAVMAEAGVGFSALDLVGVTVGPGSFTGLRVGLAFAKGLGAALSIPVAGVGTLAALAAAEPEGFVAAALDARRDQVYLQAFLDGQPLTAPEALSLGAAAERLAQVHPGGPAVLIGSGAPLLDGVLAGARLVEADGADPVRVAQLAARAPQAPARPLYLRAPDARLPAA